VEEAPPRRKQPAVGDVANAIVRELEVVAHGAQHVGPHHLLDRLGGMTLVHAAGRAEQREVELAPDDRGHRGGRLTARAEPVESTRDEVTDALGQRGLARPRAGTAGRGLRSVSEHGFHGDEGIALAHGPDARFERGHVAADARERTHDRRDVVSR
jgi:hypothetical protein